MWLGKWQLTVAARYGVIVFCLAAFSGCIPYQQYYSRPLTPAGVHQRLDVNAEAIDQELQSGESPASLPQTDVPRIADGLSPEEASYLAVMANPGLRAIRDQRGVVGSQVIQAGILPNPQFGFNSDSPSFGATAGAVTANTESLSWDISKLNPRGAKILSAFAAVDAVDWEIAWQEWLVAQAARQAVFDLVAVRQQITKLEEAEKVLQANFKLVQKAEKEGNLTIVDLSAAASASATIRTDI